VLVRVSDAGSGRIWLILADTLARLVDLYDQAAVHQVESHLPHALVSHEFLGMPLWQWLAILIAVPIAAAWHGWQSSSSDCPGIWARYPNMRGRSLEFVRAAALVVLAVLAHGSWCPTSYSCLAKAHYQQVAGVVRSSFQLGCLADPAGIAEECKAPGSPRRAHGHGIAHIQAERILKVAIFVLAIFTVMGTSLQP